MAFIELPNTFKVWKQKHFLEHQVDPKISAWLLDSNSLTERVIKHCQSQNHNNNDASHFSVDVLKQNTAIVNLAEASKLNMQADQKAYFREVLLYCDKTPVVYAKTIIPLTTLTGKQQKLASLGNKPLGAYLFAQPNLVRDDIEVSPISHKQQKLWARRSVFYLEKKPLLVYEVFLSELLRGIIYP